MNIRRIVVQVHELYEDVGSVRKTTRVLDRDGQGALANVTPVAGTPQGLGNVGQFAGGGIHVELVGMVSDQGVDESGAIQGILVRGVQLGACVDVGCECMVWV